MAIYLKIDGADGDATDDAHKGWIGCESMSFGVSRDIQIRTGSGANREAHAAHVSEVNIAKQMDKSTPALFTQSTVGKALDKVIIHLTQQGDGGTINYMEYTLSKCMVAGYDVSCALDMQPQENVRLSFTKLEMKFTPHDAKNKAGSPIPAGYDIETAKKV